MSLLRVGRGGKLVMTAKLLLALIFMAALGAPVGYVYYNAHLSPDNWVHTGTGLTSWKDGGAHAVPRPPCRSRPSSHIG